MIKATFYQTNEHFSVFSTIVRDLVDKHAPLKQKVIRGNNVPFMNSELRTAIMNRLRIKNRYVKWTSWKTFLKLKRYLKNTLG